MKYFLLALALLSTIHVAAQAQAGHPPNIILILADDLGYGEVDYQGQQKIFTPNIDRVAAEGMRFTQFYAGTAVCALSRASLMTGLHTGHTAIRGNRGYKPEGQFPLPDSSLTIASVLRDHGYVTGALGKWGLGSRPNTRTRRTSGTTRPSASCMSLASTARR